ncbi:MAG: SgcJ/EcaC family oxidoreductase [Gemmataceae bacterium]|nr:SgcJ/EcaC family oxidoreductase [Gemmataceae bacterium]
MRSLLFGLIAVALGWQALPQALPHARADQAEDEAAIRKTVDSYAAAFNQRDAKALAAHWLPEAVYIDPDSGAQVVGRAAIEKHFAEVFKDLKKAKLAVAVESIRFISPHVALEQGTANIVGLDKEPTKSSYAAIHVKRDGKWLLDRVTEKEAPTVMSHYDKLKDLEWLVGAWIDGDDDGGVETICKWAKNQNFLVRTFSVSARDQITVSGVQIIGWDPSAKRIRSWVFDSNGGFGEGLWTKKGKSWHIQTRDTLPGGQKSAAVNILTYVDQDSFTWQSVDRQAAGQLLPNIGEVTVVRKAATE